MSIHICTNGGHAEPIVGENGGRNMAAEFNLPWLGSLPLQLSIRTQTDSGNPSVIAEPQGEEARAYHDIAQRIAANAAALPRDMYGKMPMVVARTEYIDEGRVSLPFIGKIGRALGRERMST